MSIIPDTNFISSALITPKLGSYNRRFYLLTMAGSPVLEWDAALGYDSANTSYIVDDPIEGGFTSHDKVRSPMTVSIMVTVTDSQRRQLFLSEADAAMDDVTLYQLVTPDIVHENLSIVGANPFKTPDNFYNSVGMQIKLREVRLNGDTRIEQTTEPQANPMTHGGQVTPIEMDSSFISLDIPKVKK